MIMRRARPAWSDDRDLYVLTKNVKSSMFNVKFSIIKLELGTKF